MDCTLRDGANVVGNGFSPELTKLMIEGLIRSNIHIIEMGNAKGLGATEKGSPAPISDAAYLDLIQPYLSQADIGMFLNAKRYEPENVAMAADKGCSFLRIGMDAGDGAKAYHVIEDVKKHGITARYSLMKAYLLTPEELAEEAAGLEAHGLDEITIMDSAGTMLPQDSGLYVKALKERIKIPVGFHCHNNLGLSTANALAAFENGVDVLDCGLLGMARSAGNLPTEIAVALMQMKGAAQEVDLYQLLDFEDRELIPAMEKEGYHTPIKPKDLILGYSGAHSTFMPLFRKVAGECNVGLYPLIVETSIIDRKNPSEELMRETAARIQAKGEKA
ncbi:4-hydroxy-2-oxovalerate aldolase [Clostridium merdae]|uniref:4-hydroxy-2-oxovalerate aldolase n=1 Tax=Clostridium merdae TaxID=1958780 RepID=UPI000A26ECBE|nr:4-hydroxy-2-oxovalerate aldolase [Clostridium merdae]